MNGVKIEDDEIIAVGH
jgi:hypothetical protein